MFLPGLTFETIPNSLRIKGLLSRRTAQIIATLDQPAWYYRWFSKAPSENQLKESLKLCGIKTIGVKYIGIVKNSTDIQRKNWLSEIEKFAKR